MDTTIRLPRDFKEFLKLLEENEVEYLLVGGYAVGLHGYPRPTGDIDFWISRSSSNAEKVFEVFVQFGFNSPDLSVSLFTLEKSIVRMGVAPFKIEVITHIDGVRFDDCYPSRLETQIDGCNVKVINYEDLLTNKKASGRPKDINDLIELGRMTKKDN
jgi:predicted nucleotidyltransferase